MIHLEQLVTWILLLGTDLDKLDDWSWYDVNW